MATYNEQLQSIFALYSDHISDEPTDLKVVAAWAIEEGLWKPADQDLHGILRNQLARALREEYHTDAKGRRYRAKHAVLEKDENGKQTSLWADIDTAPSHHMKKAFAQRRKQIVGDCYQLHQDVEHYNDENPGQDIQLSLDFTEDVIERCIEEGVEYETVEF